MNRYLLGLLFVVFQLYTSAQSFKNQGYATDSTLEVMTWNTENFPKNGQATINNMTSIINELGVDLIALQEIEDIQSFEQLVQNLNGYAYAVEPGYFAGLGYIYKTGTITINSIYEIYSSSSFWSPFPRAPLVIDFDFMGHNFIVINNHFKCCGDGFLNLADPDDEESRRYKATNLLKDHIDNSLNNKNVIVVGDLNDELEDEYENNVFRDIIDDDVYNYKFADYAIALGPEANWSYPTWPSHLDHILITRELFPSFANEGSDIQTLKVDEMLTGGWAVYSENVSDHRPVALKLNLAVDLGTNDLPGANSMLSVQPNPCVDMATFRFDVLTKPATIIIHDVYGKIVSQASVPSGAVTWQWIAADLPSGVYFASLVTDTGVIRATKVLISR